GRRARRWSSSPTTPGWPGGSTARSASGTDASRTTPSRPAQRRGGSMLRYVWRDLVRNPRRTLASLVGLTLGVALFSGVLFFSDGAGATMTQRAIAPLTL